MTMTKHCKACDNHKDIEEFSLRSDSEHIRRSHCKSCRSINAIAYRKTGGEVTAAGDIDSSDWVRYKRLADEREDILMSMIRGSVDEPYAVIELLCKDTEEDESLPTRYMIGKESVRRYAFQEGTLPVSKMWGVRGLKVVYTSPSKEECMRYKEMLETTPDVE